MFYFTKHSLKQIYTNFWVHCLLLFFGKGGLLRHGFCSNWHCGPAKFLGQLHWLGEIQIPLFWHGITHIATKQIKFKLTFQNSKKKRKKSFVYVHKRELYSIQIPEFPIPCSCIRYLYWFFHLETDVLACM